MLFRVENSGFLGYEAVSVSEWFWMFKRNVMLSYFRVKRFMDPLALIVNAVMNFQVP